MAEGQQCPTQWERGGRPAWIGAAPFNEQPMTFLLFVLGETSGDRGRSCTQGSRKLADQLSHCFYGCSLPEILDLFVCLIVFLW